MIFSRGLTGRFLLDKEGESARHTSNPDIGFGMMGCQRIRAGVVLSGEVHDGIGVTVVDAHGDGNVLVDDNT